MGLNSELFSDSRLTEIARAALDDLRHKDKVHNIDRRNLYLMTWVDFEHRQRKFTLAHVIDGKTMGEHRFEMDMDDLDSGHYLEAVVKRIHDEIPRLSLLKEQATGVSDFFEVDDED